MRPPNPLMKTMMASPCCFAAPWLRRAVSLPVWLLAAGVSHAAIIASDDFLTGGPTENYAATNLNGQVKTAGTSGYYTAAAAGSQTPGWASGTGAFTAAVGGLTHPLSVNPAGANDGRTVATGNANNRIQYRDFVSTTPPPSTDYYFSAMMSKSAVALPGASYVGLSVSRIAGQNATAVTSGMFVGFSASSLSLFYNDGTAMVTKSLVTTADMNLTYLATLHYNTTTGLLTPSVYDSTGALVNNPAADAVTATLAATDMGAFHYTISSGFVNASSPTLAYDQLRFGTTLSDVIIPEPSAVALLVAGVTMVGWRRRR